VTYLLDTNAISDLMRAAPEIENWMAGLDRGDRVVTCLIVRGEILFGIARLPMGKRRAELEATGHRFLAAFPCETGPRTGRLLAGACRVRRFGFGRESCLKGGCRQDCLPHKLGRGPRDFDGIDGLSVIARE